MSLSSRTRPLVGIAVLVVCSKLHPNCVLVSQRLASHGQGTHQLPGGHLEYGESFEECAQRELKEETNLHCSSFELVHVTNTVFSTADNGQGKHYVTLFLRARIDDDATLTLMEPDKNSPWIWMNWNQLRSMNLFSPLRQAVDHPHFNPFDHSLPTFTSLVPH